MKKNEVLLAAKMNSAWRYQDQLALARYLETALNEQDLATWDHLNLALRRHLEFFPSELSATTVSESYLTLLDDDYPLELAEIYQPPVLLFYRGRRELLARRKLAIVGARYCTTYSRDCLQQLLPPLIRAGFVTVSGLAFGVDTLVHQETFWAGGQTIAVIGNGLDLVYPLSNAQLQEDIGRQGLVLSEYPPNSPPQKFHFPQRNRIIAGLAEGTMVTEAKKRSGSLITANLALQENRNVYAVPGGIFVELSQGTNQLIQAGALPVLTAQDILDDLQFSNKIQNN